MVIGATNRPEILDQALLRPGRFDRRVAVQPPDRNGRLKILEVHTRSMPLGKDVDLGALASTTPGMVGADLANLANEAALLAAHRGHDVRALRGRVDRRSHRFGTDCAEADRPDQGGQLKATIHSRGAGRWRSAFPCELCAKSPCAESRFQRGLGHARLCTATQVAYGWHPGGIFAI